MARKQYPLRIDPQIWEAVQRWANDDFRSVNAQVEWILRDALRRAGRLRQATGTPGEETSPGGVPDPGHDADFGGAWGSQ